LATHRLVVMEAVKQDATDLLSEVVGIALDI
jgi:hypothetical protein